MFHGVWHWPERSAGYDQYSSVAAASRQDGNTSSSCAGSATKGRSQTSSSYTRPASACSARSHASSGDTKGSGTCGNAGTSASCIPGCGGSPTAGSHYASRASTCTASSSEARCCACTGTSCRCSSAGASCRSGRTTKAGR